MPVKVNLPDGRVVNFPDGMNPADIEKALAEVTSPMPAHVSPQVPVRTWTDTAIDALPTVGGFAGGLIGGAGGTAFGLGVGGAPGAIGGAALGGMAGEGIREAVQTFRGKEAPRSTGQALSDVATQGVVQGGAEAGGRVVGAGLRTIGRGLYRAGAMPILQMTTKYDDLIKTGLENRVPVTKSGLKTAGELATEAKATKETAVLGAGQTAGLRTRGVVDDALQKAYPSADQARRAGLGDPSAMFQSRADRIVTENGPGLRPDQLEEIKHTLDDQLGGAYKKLRAREPLTPTERMNLELSQAAGRAQESVVPNYRAMNKDVMDKVGLQRMIGRRLAGKNQGLENIATALMGPAAIPARIALLPGVASSAGIASHVAGERPAIPANAIRAALATLMASHAVEDQ